MVPPMWRSSIITEEDRKMVRIPTDGPPTHPGTMLLEEFLKPLGLSQVELAERIGVSFPRVNENRPWKARRDTGHGASVGAAVRDGGTVLAESSTRLGPVPCRPLAGRAEYQQDPATSTGGRGGSRLTTRAFPWPSGAPRISRQEPRLEYRPEGPGASAGTSGAPMQNLSRGSSGAAGGRSPRDPSRLGGARTPSGGPAEPPYVSASRRLPRLTTSSTLNPIRW